jgi:hypothetical protein
MSAQINESTVNPAYAKGTGAVGQPMASTNDGASYIDWPAIFAGIVLASAVSIILLTFGSAIGLSFLSAASGDTVTAGIIAAVLYAVWAQVSALMAGAYLTGRLRRRVNDATEHEVDVRDGSHGLIVWAGAILLGTYLAASGIGAVGNIAGSAAGTIASAVDNPTDAFTDTLLRSDTRVAQQQRIDEVGRMLTKTATGTLSAEDQDYLTGVVAGQTGLAPDDAKARVDGVLAQIETVKDDAAIAAERARKVGILSAFLVAAALLVGAAASYWSARTGGDHRDANVVFNQWFAPRKTRAVTR